MAKVRKINVSKVQGDDSNNTSSSEVRPYGEIAVYEGIDNKLELLMFDGVRTNLKSKVLNKGTFYGGDADSGDGLNYDTIKLIPDAELHRNDSVYGNDQYLIIDPTGGEPNHIHIRAGGTIDSSTTDLFLGGEKNNVRVSDTNDRVSITTDAGGSATNSWTFAGDGTTIFPNGLIKTQANQSIGILAIDGGSLSEYPAQLMAQQVAQAQPDTVISSYDNRATIQTDVNGTIKTWTFGRDGSLTFPNDTVQTTAWTGIPGPYADDAAAALANVAVGSPYYQVSGQVFVRLV